VAFMPSVALSTSAGVGKSLEIHASPTTLTTAAGSGSTDSCAPPATLNSSTNLQSSTTLQSSMIVGSPSGVVRSIPSGSCEPSSPTVPLPSMAATPATSESTHLFRESVLIVEGHFRERRSSLSLPVRPSPWLRTLSEKILAWWKTVSRICPGIKSPSSSGVLPFVGTVLSFLGSPRGLVVGGVTLIRPSSRVRRHLPTARQMGLFGRLSCRKLSQCSRQLRSGLLTPSGGVRVVPCLEF
jgi:hypothetical protein